MVKVKRDPDDLISALSKNLKAEKAPVVRITFKRGDLFQQQFTKAHSRKAKQQLKSKVKAENSQDDKEWPLIVRYRQNSKQQITRLNAVTRTGKSQQFIHSLLGVFRVNFFKKKNEKVQKIQLVKTKANPESKSSARKLAQKLRNKERKDKRKLIKKQKKRSVHSNKMTQNQTSISH